MRLLLSLIVILVPSAWVATSRTSAQEFRAGAATSNITPPLGDDIIGGFAPIHSTHIHDELQARCLVLDDGKSKLALVVCDLLGFHPLVSRKARELIAAQSKIPPECVLISATHTHSATSALGEDKPEPSLNEYQSFVAKRIADGVARAVNELRPAEITFGTAEAPEHLNNRRWTMRPGTIPPNPFGGADLVQMNPPPGSPNLMEPAGPIDPTISFIAVREAGGKPISVFAAYSLHYVGGVGPGHISADYFGMFCRELEQPLGAERQSPPFVALMANGTSGDINNINFRNPGPGRQPYEQMHSVAADVAAKVHATLEKLQYQPHAVLAARYREPTLAWRRPDAALCKWAEETLAANPTPRGLAPIYARRVLNLAAYPETVLVPIQALRIGDVCLATMPCEVFCEIGLEFKRRSPTQPAFMVSLNHGYIGYLPTPRQLDLGGYETWIGTNRLERDASNKLLTNLLEMAEELKQQPASETKAPATN